MMLTKTKNGRKGHAELANSEGTASTESRSTAALTEDVSHATECQPRQEHAIDEIDEFDMAIRELAYHKWEAAGFPPGDGFDFWLEAEREVKANQSAESSGNHSFIEKETLA